MSQDLAGPVGSDFTLRKGRTEKPIQDTPGGARGSPRAEVDTAPGQPITGAARAGEPISPEGARAEQ